jgi:serine/threonine protein kinase
LTFHSFLFLFLFLGLLILHCLRRLSLQHIFLRGVGTEFLFFLSFHLLKYLYRYSLSSYSSFSTFSSSSLRPRTHRYAKIISGKINYPDNFSPTLEDVIAKLCTKNPSKRLGNMKGGIADLIKHKWFGAFDWKGLRKGSIAAPWVPEAKTAAATASALDAEDTTSVVSCAVCLLCLL